MIVADCLPAGSLLRPTNRIPCCVVLLDVPDGLVRVLLRSRAAARISRTIARSRALRVRSSAWVGELRDGLGSPRLPAHVRAIFDVWRISVRADRNRSWNQCSSWIPVAPGTPGNLSKSAEVRLTKSALILDTCEIRTKSAKSRGSENGGRREQISGLGADAPVQSFGRESPCLLAIFARSQAVREYLARCASRLVESECGAVAVG